MEKGMKYRVVSRGSNRGGKEEGNFSEVKFISPSTRNLSNPGGRTREPFAKIYPTFLYCVHGSNF
jgi:hypothetical protein